MNNTMILIKNRKYFIYSSVLLLFIISTYLTYLLSPELSKLFGFDNLNTMFLNQVSSIVIGISIIAILGNLNSKLWFDKIGRSVFVFSVILFFFMLFAPESSVAYIDEQRLFLVVGKITINPMMFFSIGSIWIISFVAEKNSKKLTNIIIFVLMIITAFFCVEFNDIITLLLMEIVFFNLLIYINGINRLSIVSLLGMIIIGVFFILMAEHRIQRIKSWFELSSDFMTTLPIEKALHENILLSLISNIGMFSFVVAMVCFLLISYLILTYDYKKESYKIFAVGVVALILIDLTLNILYSFGYSPVYPPSIYLLGYGSSIVIASSTMVGMLMMIIKIHNT